MTGPQVALVHGFGTSFETTWVGNGWTALLEDAGRKVIGIDLLGHGTAEKPAHPDDYRNLEQRVLDVLPPEPVDGIGFSMGSQVLLWLAAHHPERFGRLVLSGIGRSLFESDAEWRPKMVEAVRTGVAATPELRYFAQLPEAPDADRTALVSFLERPDRRKFPPELLASVTLPVLVAVSYTHLTLPTILLV